ncbi:TFIIB-type zinc ribbon-containing protein [Aporhodopirellula aestuarii]|uniref:Zf-TFIIB domain-containing protein n=1 Tax=Aporhodopirellula aestuarii TaxID=2950107 RepID=A0ABT0U5C8_9BACT|nr:zf-TFIIB domain-containing protein [Aporhodopirellula aestuarii]MCM2372139.1 zf-TFIIB domain-containing protein [Aporhodopirellula aestuarii]
MQCPRDGSTLVSTKYEGEIVVDQCPSCGGVWLDAGELQALQQLAERDHKTYLRRIDIIARAYEFARQETRPEITCPKCGGRLEAGEYVYCSQIMIDRCVDCAGVWLDKGELAALEQFFEEAALQEQEEKGLNLRHSFFASLFHRE